MTEVPLYLYPTDKTPEIHSMWQSQVEMKHYSKPLIWAMWFVVVSHILPLAKNNMGYRLAT